MQQEVYNILALGFYGMWGSRKTYGYSFPQMGKDVGSHPADCVSLATF